MCTSPIRCTRDVEELPGQGKATAIHCPACSKTNHESLRGSGFSLDSLCLLASVSPSHKPRLGRCYRWSTHGLPSTYLCIYPSLVGPYLDATTTIPLSTAPPTLTLTLTLQSRSVLPPVERTPSRLPLCPLLLFVLLLCCSVAPVQRPGQLEPRTIQAYRIVD